jgi:glucose-1-phosphate adenylyltransferase
VLVFGADHIYKMNIRQMIDHHHAKNAIATVACLPIPVHEAYQFGIVQTDAEGRIVGFQEKPQSNPATIPGDPEHCLGSMGNYVFHPGALVDELRADGELKDSRHDFGGEILPSMLKTGRVFAYNFGQNRIRGVSDEIENAYWRDVGTLDAYYEANMDLKNVVPSLNLYNWDWPIMTAQFPDPPAKLVFDEETRRGIALQSILSGGCIVAGGFVKDSVLGRNVFVDAGAEVRDSLLFDNVYVGRGARVYRAIIDKNVRVADGDHIGHDLARDKLRFTVSEGGVTVVQKAKDTLLTRSRNF